MGHPIVADAAVIGIPDEYAGEVPKAFVVVQENESGRKDAAKVLIEFVQKNKARHKWLAGGVEFLEQIPKSASGKILRRELRDRQRQQSVMAQNC